ncbi:WG repeat-containing protein [Hymenobacter gummosus]|uniref:WG repeat-containing protein n=1 Tax=Hymenobacter gummosus TaxID=1776032 RepID=A0A431TY73_9BACT|nr:WG repeat-containing protein [Hymenobacter gummosus]RTQ46775.1 WG repeat-containing protein [Hymenobacter gummosus]
MRISCVVYLWIYLLLPGALRAQAGPPSGGYRLREVRVLRPVPEPPGGLVPYRRGQFWGYADTTGRLVIAPVLDDKPGFFQQGYAEVSGELPYRFQRRLTQDGLHHTIRWRAAYLNARGEVLLIRRWEAAVLQPDGSLVCQRRRRAVGQLELHPWEEKRPGAFPAFADFWPRYPRQPSRYADFGPRRVAPDTVPRQYFLRHRRFQVRTMGAGRVAIANRVIGHGPRFRNEVDSFRRALTPRQRQREDHPLAVGRWNGRRSWRLTRYRFAELEPFAGGLAPAAVITAWDEHNEPTEKRWGYLDQRGRWRIRPRFEEASAFRQGRAVVKTTAGYGIIDRQGQYQLAPQAAGLDEPDEAGFVRQRAAQAGVRLLAPPARAAGFADSLNAQAGDFRQGRVWVQRGPRQGLLNLRGQWVTPLAYELLVAPRGLNFAPQNPGVVYGDNLVLPPPESDAAEYLLNPWSDAYPLVHPLPDTAYLLARRAGRYGFVARHSGREVVPCRYDSATLMLYHGFGCAYRGGQPFVLDPQGRELAAGRYRGIDFLTPRGRLLHLTRTSPDTAWALLDTTGRQRTPWVAGQGYPTPEGWLLSRRGRTWQLLDSTGRVVHAAPRPIRHADLDPQWQRIQRQPRMGLYQRKTADLYWSLVLGPPQPAGRTAFMVEEEGGGVRLLDARLRELARSPYRPDESRGHGWFWIALPAGTRQRPAPDFRLLAPSGGLLPVFAGEKWLEYEAYHELYYQRGLLPTDKGYRTRGGRRLWED